jgi:lysophospholipase L1-like esterase
MAITSGYFNSVNGDRKYNADQMSEYFEGIINEGVCQHIGGGLAVTAGTGLTVSVATGKAFIGQKWIKNDAALTLTITTAADQARIDAVVLRRNTTNRVCEIAVKTGTPSASPSAPAMTRTSTTYEMALAYVNVAAGATSVTVTDKRADTTVCGWATVAQATSGEVDQMLNDMKTGFDGVEYSSPAEMVQGEDQKIYNKVVYNEDIAKRISDGTIKPVLGFINYTIDSGFIKTDGTTDSDYYHIGISVAAGQLVNIKSKAGLQLRSYVLKDGGGNVVDYSSEDTWNTEHDYDIFYVVPTSGTLYVNSTANNFIGAYLVTGYEQKETSVESYLMKKKNKVHYKILDNGEKTAGYIIATDSYRRISITSDQSYFYYKIEVKPNTVYKIIGFSIQKIKAFYLTDNDGLLLDTDYDYNEQNVYTLCAKKIITGSTAKWLYLMGSSLSKAFGSTSGENIKVLAGGIVAEENETDVGNVLSYNWNKKTSVAPFNFDYDSGGTNYQSRIIPVYQGDKWFVRSMNYYKLLGVSYINDNGQIIDSSATEQDPTSVEWFNRAIDIPEDGYLIISTARSWNPVYWSKVKNDSCFGKKWYVIGDSFTEFYPDREREKVINYVDLVSGYLGLVPTNTGVGGTGYRAPMPGDMSNSFTTKALGCAGYDLVTIYGSFNDLATTLPLGTVTDTTTDTLAGCMYTTLKNIRDTEPLAQIVVIAPAPWITQNSVTGNAWGSIHPDDYVDMLKAICKRYDVLLVNPYSESGACPWRWKLGDDVYDLTYLYDGTHYNTAGHKKFIAPLVIEGILKAFRQTDICNIS